MNKLLVIALLCLSSTALAHDIYNNLRDRDGHLCCGGQDCRPVEARVLANGNYYLPATGETIPPEMATPSPDGRFHQCIYYPLSTRILKARLPSRSASEAKHPWKSPRSSTSIIYEPEPSVE